MSSAQHPVQWDRPRGSIFGWSRHERLGQAVLQILMLGGLGALLYYYSWWRSPGRIVTPWLALLLAGAAVYTLAQLIASWSLYFAARRRGAPPPPDIGLTVDVFVTACGEPVWLVERSLTAALAIRGQHRTWLLDDADDPELEALAERLGAGYLTREGGEGRKAGNVNAALERTDGDAILIFDVDHVPTPEYLERTLGYLGDPNVGFVQGMLTFYNGEQGFIARAATESSFDYYNPTCMGSDRVGSASLVGTNALIRRKALESIGGYRPGLAEDLATSIALHAASWRSVYVAEPLAPGLSPADATSWFTQQLKWSRGVFELLLTDYPRYFGRLTWGQRLSYLVRMTYYWLGPVVAVHVVFLLALLFGGSGVAKIDFQEYLIHIAPAAVCVLLIRQIAIRFWRHPSVSPSFLWRPWILVPATWPVYTLGWMMALLRMPLSFRATGKTPTAREFPLGWLLPQLVTSALLVGASPTRSGSPRTAAPRC